jgi:RluA family pseudouridine synthase
LLYEDRWLIVVDKPPGVSLASGRGEESRAVRRLLSAAGIAEDANARLVHRLDAGTSGVVLLARDALSHRRMSEAFQARRVEKTYEAIVRGTLEPREGEIDGPIAIDRRDRRRMAVDPRGKSARTFYRVLRRLDGACLVCLEPRTGRTHQIRVHLAARGHPVLGDRLYGGPRSIGRLVIARPLLHARSLEFFHPATGERMRIRAPRPKDFRSALEAAARAGSGRG